MKNPTDYFNTICKITNAIGITSRYEDLLDLIVTSAVEAMKGKGAALFLESGDGDYFVSVASTGLSEDYQHANPMSIKTRIDSVLKEGGYLAVRDAASDPRIPNHQSKKDEGIESFLSVPVMVKGISRGVLTLYTGDKRDFDEHDITLLKTLAEQGGLAIERSRLIKGVITYAKLFKSFSENINSSLEIKAVLKALTCDICEALQMKGAVIRLKDEETDELKVVANCGLSEDFLKKGPIFSDEGFSKVMNGETLVVEDVTNYDLIPYHDFFVNEEIPSILSVPIKTKKAVIGIMNLYSDVKTDFSKGVVEIAEALAIQGGIAIQNASLYLKLNETKESLEQDTWGYRSWF